MGRRRKRKSYERDIDGILLLDKPAGITSNNVLQNIRRLYRAYRAGHTGSLDRPATGILPLCFGEATKISPYLLDSDKSYIAVAKLGIVTDTKDSEGKILEIRQIPKFNKRRLEKVIAQFIGDIEQVPPMYSALKINGQRLYKLAYQGLNVERKQRHVTIHCIDLLHFDEDSFKIRVRCSKGTYIRTLIEDIGKLLGCGAHVNTLRRLSIGPFNETQTVSMETIKRLSEKGDAALDKLLLSADSALEHLAELNLIEEAVYCLRLGQAVSVPEAPAEGLLRIYDHNRAFIGTGVILDDGRVAPKRLFKTSNQS